MKKQLGLSASFKAFVHVGICVLSLITASAMADPVDKTVVKWGEPGGDLGIITTVSGDSTTMNTTYTWGNTITKDAPNTDYYESYNADEDTPLFNGAGSLDGNLEVRSATDGDAFYYPKNLGTGSHQHMFAWEVETHTLNRGGTLKSFTVENKLRATDNSGTRRFIIKEQGSWYISEANSSLSTSYSSWSVDPSTLAWFDFTPFSSGSYSIGESEVTPTFKDYTAVGVYYDIAVTGGAWADVRTRYFKVVAEVSEYDIVKWGKAGGDLNIITNLTGDSITINATYTPGTTITKDAPSTDYYKSYNAATDTPLFNGAGSFDGNLEVRDAGDGDNFYCPIYNALTEQRMYVWETGVHTLTNGGKLVKFTVENKMRDASSTGIRRFLVKESGNWYVSETNSINPTVYTSWSVDPETLEWFEFTPFSSGSYSIGTSASPKFRNYEAVGVFYESKHNSTGWHHARTRYFNVVADDIPVPPPQGTIILVM